MGKALYRKYRPRKLDDVKGQDHITSTLKNAIESDKLAHAYLFTGPRGVGKTSIARILAHEINNIAYSDESFEIDIVEIDAASNRGVDEIRDLKEKAYIAPSNSKYKIYIIDEVHMLTAFAFNALLKLLEEPPKHVIFILATTDFHKLPDTIVSRTQRFNFNSVNDNDLEEQLTKIAKKEKINIDKSAIKIIAHHGQGSFRDAISLLDQMHSFTNIQSDDVYNILGVPSDKKINNLLSMINKPQNLAEVSLYLDNLLGQGSRPLGISEALHSKLRQEIISGTGKPEYLNLMNELININNNDSPTRQLEIILLKYAQQNIITKNTTKKSAVDIQPKKPNNEKTELKQKNTEAHSQETPENNNIVYDSKLSEDIFTELLNNLKQKYNTLYSIVRMAEHEFVDDELILSFKFSFHQKRINEENNQKILKDIIHKISGKKTKITCLLKQSSDNEISEVDDTKDMATISNIFGGGELLES